MTDETLRALKDIESQDPDGFPNQPNAADHDRHRSWAIENYGHAMWELYRAGGWRDEPYV